MPKLAGKFALITGGNSGIGLATARLFVSEGARVAISGRDSDTLAHTAKSLGDAILAIRADIVDANDRDHLFAKLKDRFGRLDIVFANAGISGNTPLGATEVPAFEKIIQTNISGTFFTVQGALPLLRDGASIILNSSVIATGGAPGYSAYAASKAGVRAMARVFAAELSPRGIRVNVVTPGAIRTPIWGRTRTEQEVAATLDRFSKTVPLRRLGEAEEVAKAVLFLASDDASYVQGADLVVDGGIIGLPMSTVPARTPV